MIESVILLAGIERVSIISKDIDASVKYQTSYRNIYVFDTFTDQLLIFITIRIYKSRIYKLIRDSKCINLYVHTCRQKKKSQRRNYSLNWSISGYETVTKQLKIFANQYPRYSMRNCFINHSLLFDGWRKYATTGVRYRSPALASVNHA